LSFGGFFPGRWPGVISPNSREIRTQAQHGGIARTKCRFFLTQKPVGKKSHPGRTSRWASGPPGQSEHAIEKVDATRHPKTHLKRPSAKYRTWPAPSANWERGASSVHTCLQRPGTDSGVGRKTTSQTLIVSHPAKHFPVLPPPGISGEVLAIESAENIPHAKVAVVYRKDNSYSTRGSKTPTSARALAVIRSSKRTPAGGP